MVRFVLILNFLILLPIEATRVRSKRDRAEAIRAACQLDPSFSFCQNQPITTAPTVTTSSPLTAYCNENSQQYHYYCEGQVPKLPEIVSYCETYKQQCSPTASMPNFPTIPTTTTTTVTHRYAKYCADTAEQYYYYCIDPEKLENHPELKTYCPMYEKQCSPTPPTVAFPTIPTTTVFAYSSYCEKYAEQYYYYCTKTQGEVQKYCPIYERYCSPSPPTVAFPTIPTPAPPETTLEPCNAACTAAHCTTKCKCDYTTQQFEDNCSSGIFKNNCELWWNSCRDLLDPATLDEINGWLNKIWAIPSFAIGGGSDDSGTLTIPLLGDMIRIPNINTG